jgi:hypothetical protein
MQDASILFGRLQVHAIVFLQTNYFYAILLIIFVVILRIFHEDLPVKYFCEEEASNPVTCMLPFFIFVVVLRKFHEDLPVK